MVKKYHSWDEIYDDLQEKSYKDVLDTDIVKDNYYYEIPIMINHYKKQNDEKKINFLICLEEKIENENGRVYTIGDKFILDTDLVYCHIEIIDFIDIDVPCIEFSNVKYKTKKREIPKDIKIDTLKRLY